jgi:hypothetical protein
MEKQERVVTKGGQKIVEETTVTEISKEQLEQRLEGVTRQIDNLTARKSELESLLGQMK